MRIQFNLLPDVKQQYIKIERTKKTVMLVAFIAAGVSLFLFAAMASTVYIVNKKQLSDADKNVARYTKQLQDIPNLNRILTVQNQLKALVPLHQNKHISSRIFQYLPQVTPTDIKMGKLTIDFKSNTMQISGTADSQKTINTFIDTLKFTTYKIGGQDSKKRAFPSVIESSFGLAPTGASYGLNVQFDPVLFSNLQKVELIVPAGLATTRSVLNDPSNTLFNGQTGQEGQ